MMSTEDCYEYHHVSENPFFKNILKNLSTFLKDSEFCDVNLLIGKRQFHAHRVVLAANSPYFHAMFSSGLIEVHQSDVELHGVHPKIFQQLLDFMYSGEITVTEETCQDLLAAADMFGLGDLLQACCGYMLRQLHPANCIGIFQFADKHSCMELKETTETYIHNHFQSVIREDEFLSLSKESLVYILESELLNIDNEFQVFQAAMAWIFHNLKNRRRFVFEVLLPVRFPIISPKILDKYVMECPDLSLKIAVKKLLDDFRTKRADFGLARYRLSHMQPRKSARKRIYMIGGYCRVPGGKWMDSQTLDSVDCFDLFHQEWIVQPPLHTARSSHGAVTLNGQIYVIGGESNSLIFDTAESFDPSSSKWTMIPSMTEPRCGVGLCVIEDLIYAIGGCIGLEIGKSVEMFDPNSNIWRQVDYIRLPRLAMGVAELEGLIYIVGGMNDLGTELRLTESYNPITKEWIALPDMNTRRAYVGAAALNDYVYAVGGCNEHQGALASVERFCPVKNAWEEVKPMTEPRAGASVAAVNGLLYVMGGRTSGDEYTAPVSLDSVECYDPETDSWLYICEMPISRCEATVVVL